MRRSAPSHPHRTRVHVTSRQRCARHERRHSGCPRAARLVSRACETFVAGLLRATRLPHQGGQGGHFSGRVQVAGWHRRLDDRRRPAQPDLTRALHEEHDFVCVGRRTRARYYEDIPTYAGPGPQGAAGLGSPLIPQDRGTSPASRLRAGKVRPARESSVGTATSSLLLAASAPCRWRDIPRPRRRRRADR